MRKTKNIFPSFSFVDQRNEEAPHFWYSDFRYVRLSLARSFQLLRDGYSDRSVSVQSGSKITFEYYYYFFKYIVVRIS